MYIVFKINYLYTHAHIYIYIYIQHIVDIPSFYTHFFPVRQRPAPPVEVRLQQRPRPLAARPFPAASLCQAVGGGTGVPPRRGVRADAGSRGVSSYGIGWGEGWEGCGVVGVEKEFSLKAEIEK